MEEALPVGYYMPLQGVTALVPLSAKRQDTTIQEHRASQKYISVFQNMLTPDLLTDEILTELKGFLDCMQ